MRIKTSKYVHDNLAEAKNFVNFENNAQVLKLALNIALNGCDTSPISSFDGGFEVDVNILFGDEKKYYFILIKDFYNTDEIDKNMISELIEYGFEKLVYYIKISKRSNLKFMELILEDLCI